MIRVISLLPALALTAGIAFAQDAAAPETAAPETAAPETAAPETAASEPAPAATAAPVPTETPQPQAVPLQMDADAAYESARNQLGVLKFCQEQGHNDAKAVEIQDKLLAMLPAGDSAKGDAAEAKGLTGTVSALGNEQTLETAATAQGTTVESLCQQMNVMIQQLAAQLPV